MRTKGREGVVASVKHFLGKASIDDQDLGAEVEEHGVGCPASDELDGIFVNAGAWQGRGAAGAHRARADELWGDAGCLLSAEGSFAKGFGDVPVGHVAPHPVRALVFT